MLVIDVQHVLNETWSRVATFVPKLVGFVVIVFLGDVLAMVLARVVDRMLERIGLDRWVQRGLLGRPLESAGVDASDVLWIVTFWAVFLFVVQLALGVFGPNPISDVLERLIAYLPNVFAAVVVLVIAAALANVVSDELGTMLTSVPDGMLIARLAELAIVTFGVFAALDQLQIAPAIAIAPYYAVLAALDGVFIVAVGAGGMPTMRRYWERASNALEASTSEVRGQVAGGAELNEAESEDESMTIWIDGASDWKPPRARGYELGAAAT
ncbi:MAG: mechanosensitive ion channel family protein [Actinomycetota bacterium]